LKRHVVSRIIAPAQVPINERPPIPTAEERWAEKIAEKEMKDERRALRRQVVGAENALAKVTKAVTAIQKDLGRLGYEPTITDPKSKGSSK
jgi:small subunit ribosomal protein S17